MAVPKLTKDEIRKFQRQASEYPFRLTLSDGATLEVRRRDQITVSDDYAAVVVEEHGRSRHQIVSLRDIECVESVSDEDA